MNDDKHSSCIRNISRIHVTTTDQTIHIIVMPSFYAIVSKENERRKRTREKPLDLIFYMEDWYYDLLLTLPYLMGSGGLPGPNREMMRPIERQFERLQQLSNQSVKMVGVKWWTYKDLYKKYGNAINIQSEAFFLIPDRLNDSDDYSFSLFRKTCQLSDS